MSTESSHGHIRTSLDENASISVGLYPGAHKTLDAKGQPVRELESHMFPAYHPKAEYDTSNSETSSASGDSSNVSDDQESAHKDGESDGKSSEKVAGQRPRSCGGKRARTLLTPEQSRVLHELLQQTCFPSTQVREAVAAKLGLSPRKVQVFFQNKRQKQRKKNSAAQSQSHTVLVPPYGAPSGSDVRHAEPYPAAAPRATLTQMTTQPTYTSPLPAHAAHQSRPPLSTSMPTRSMHTPMPDMPKSSSWDSSKDYSPRDYRAMALSHTPRPLPSRRHHSSYTPPAPRALSHPYSRDRMPEMRSTPASITFPAHGRSSSRLLDAQLPPILHHPEKRSMRSGLTPRLPSINELIAASSTP